MLNLSAFCSDYADCSEQGCNMVPGSARQQQDNETIYFPRTAGRPGRRQAADAVCCLACPPQAALQCHYHRQIVHTSLQSIIFLSRKDSPTLLLRLCVQFPVQQCLFERYLALQTCISVPTSTDQPMIPRPSTLELR